MLGREFAYEMVRAISAQDEATLQAGLARLVEAELLYQRGRPPRARYMFKHALIQDVAYASLLRSHRQQVHLQIARVLEETGSETVETQPELVAHHYTEGGQYEPAVRYWHRAGQRALERSANLEAVSHLSQGIETLLQLPDTPERAQRELELQLSLGLASRAAKGFAATAVEQAYHRARVLSETLGETERLIAILRGLFALYYVRAEWHLAGETAEAIMALAQRERLDRMMVVAHFTRGGVAYWRGDFVGARGELEEALASYDDREHAFQVKTFGIDNGVQTLNHLTLSLWALGYADQADASATRAVELARNLGHPFSLAAALTFVSWYHQDRGDWQVVCTLTEEALVISARYDFADWTTLATIIKGFAEAALRGDGWDATEVYQSLDDKHRQLSNFGRAYFLAHLAEVLGKRGRRDEALGLIAQAEAFIHDSGEQQWHADVMRVRGDLLLAAAVPTREVEVCYQTALSIARNQQAKSLELRAATSLARLWQQQDKRQDAYDLLAPVYGWFTEGFDTVDLQDAKGLLDELSSRENVG